MVLCQFYLNNNCRFGSKCNNEHLDVRATIKQEMEAAIKGNQWPLSVFGPFKEKANIVPDECDLSFEECRMQFLESQQTNTFPMYQQQLLQKIQEANSRMQSLLNVNKDVLQFAVNIYNNNDSNNGQGNTMRVSGASAFGVTPTNSTNTFGSNTNAASIFGGGNTTGSSIFGGASTQQTQNATSIFGGSTTQSTGLFGSSATQGGSIFGGGVTNTTQTSLFGAPATQQNTSSIFGQSSTFGSQQQSNIFSKPSAPAFGSSAFGSAPTAPSGLFSSAAASTFGNQSFQHSNPPQNPPDNPFGMQVPNQQSTFGQASSIGFNSSFSTNGSTPFGSASVQQSNSQPSTSNIFGNLGQQAAQAALATFTNQMPTTQQQPSPFGITTVAPPPAFGTNIQMGIQSVDPTLYSKMEDLTQEQLAAFQADEFILGQIPSVAPPKELC